MKIVIDLALKSTIGILINNDYLEVDPKIKEYDADGGKQDNDIQLKKEYALRNEFNICYNSIPERPGIYLWSRINDKCIKCYYVGQAINLRNRRWDYEKIKVGLAYPTRHFEASLKKHGIEKPIMGWHYQILETCFAHELNEKEQYWINYYINQPGISYNKEADQQDQVRTNYYREKKNKDKIQTLKDEIIRLKVDLKHEKDRYKRLIKKLKANNINLGGLYE